jgi:predicted DCC family thiol-disulfide oxidoreductase YuxK
MSVGVRVAAPPSRPVLIYDGDCDFCWLWVRRWQQSTGSAIDYLPSQDESIARRFPEITQEQFDISVQLVESDGQVYGGAQAVFRALAANPEHGWPSRLYRASTVFAQTTEAAYRVVSRHRNLFLYLTRLLWGSQVDRPTHVLSRWIFLRLLGLIYLTAFLSLGSQLDGLIGHQGILPVDRFMTAIRQQYDAVGIGLDRFRLVPTLAWLGTSDVFLHWQCAAGVVLSALVVVGMAPAPCLALLWLLYLSLATVTRTFLGFQWDNLLLEVGFLAIFLAPWRLWPRRSPPAPPSRLAVLLLQVLLFKLMFSSGCVKLASGDPSWRNLTALSFHYQTQPLPTWLAWYANQLPLWLQKLSCAGMFAIELLAPFLVFAPRRPRLLACGLLALLQLLILLTGNYAFFNWLTLALSVAVLDDWTLSRTLPHRWSRGLSRLLGNGRGPGAGVPRWQRRTTLLVAVVVVPISLLQIAFTWGGSYRWLAPVEAALTWFQPFRTVNGYGLFAVMTTERREIIVEGSDDGVTWLPYEFKDKPGDVERRPKFVAPHQPRLDWQMWFAALGDYRENAWFVHFCLHLLQGSPPVLALLERNPFAQHAPHYLRAQLFRYDFTEAAERRATGAWWRRERIGTYLPSVTLADFGRRASTAR